MNSGGDNTQTFQKSNPKINPDESPLTLESFVPSSQDKGRAHKTD